jgi:hypothetical protein
MKNNFKDNDVVKGIVIMKNNYAYYNHKWQEEEYTTK